MTRSASRSAIPSYVRLDGKCVSEEVGRTAVGFTNTPSKKAASCSLIVSHSTVRGISFFNWRVGMTTHEHALSPQRVTYHIDGGVRLIGDAWGDSQAAPILFLHG